MRPRRPAWLAERPRPPAAQPFATRLDDIVLAGNEGEITLGIAGKQVAGVKTRPARCGINAQRARCGSLVAPITTHDVRPADHEFADLCGQQAISVLVHHGDGSARNGDADRTAFPVEVFRRQKADTGTLRLAIHAKQVHMRQKGPQPVAMGGRQGAAAAVT